VDEKLLQRIQELLGQLDCPKGFPCVESDFTELCKARDIGLESFLECREAEPNSCPFSLAFGEGHFCKCPLRHYLARGLGR
jgi:hypothetical protein